MKRIILIAVAGMLVAGCGAFQRKQRPPEPVDEACAAECRMPCDDTIPKWTPADPSSPQAWDSYPRQVTLPMQAKVRQCDRIHREACVQCLDRLKEAGVTK